MALTQNEKLHRRLTRKAEQKNTKEKASFPLFADQLPRHTPTSEFWHWRFNKARAAERISTLDGNCLLGKFQERKIRTIAAGLLPLTVFQELDAYRWGTYPADPGYGISFWRDILCHGRRIVFKYDRLEYQGPFLISGGKENLAGKVQLIEMESWPPEGWVPLLTDRQFDEYLSFAPAPEHPGAVDPLNLKKKS